MSAQRYVIIHDHGTETHLERSKALMAYEALLMAGLHPVFVSGRIKS